MFKKTWIKLAALLLILAAGAGPSFSADITDVFRQAMKQYEMAEYEKALKSFVKVMRMDPNNAAAREYMLRCSQRIVETKLGSQAAETVQQEVDVQKQLEGMSPEETAVSSPDSLGDLPADALGELPAVPTVLPAAGDASSEAALPPLPSTPANARDLLAERNALTDDLRRRYLGKGNIVDVEDAGSRLAVTFYMNRLFFPLTDTLRPDAYPVLDDLRGLISTSAKKSVTFTSVDNTSPAVRHTMADLSARRTNTVFSYLLYTAFLPEAEDVASAQ